MHPEDGPVDAKLQPFVTEAMSDLLGPVVAKFVAEGFPVFDSYSGKETKRITVRDTIETALTTKVGDRYSSTPAKTVLETAVEQAIKSALDNEFKPILKDAAEKFRAGIDSVMTAKLNETLKGALGLK